MATPDGWITLKEYARLTGRNEGALRRLAGQGRLQGARKDDEGRWIIPDPRNVERFPLRGTCADGTPWWMAAVQAEPHDPWHRLGINDQGVSGVAAAYGGPPEWADAYKWYVGYRGPYGAEYRYFTNPAAQPPLGDGPEGCEDLMGPGLSLGTNPRSVPNIVCEMWCESPPARRKTRRGKKARVRRGYRGKRPS